MGTNLLMRLWWAVGTAAHTPDERPFFRDDLRRIEAEFHRVDVALARVLGLRTRFRLAVIVIEKGPDAPRASARMRAARNPGRLLGGGD